MRGSLISFIPLWAKEIYRPKLPTLIIVILLILWALTLSNTCGYSPKNFAYGPPQNLKELISSTRPQIVQVNCHSSRGSGWPLNLKHGVYIMTSYHIVKGCIDTGEDITIKSLKGQESIGVNIYDSSSDFALIGTDLFDDGLEISTEITIGAWIMSIGNPLGLDRSINFGSVSNFNGKHVIIEADLNPGDSGGPLINYRGDVVGMISSSVRDSSNLGIAISISDICEKLQNCFLD